MRGHLSRTSALRGSLHMARGWGFTKEEACKREEKDVGTRHPQNIYNKIRKSSLEIL